MGGYEDVVTATEDTSYSRIQKVNVDSNVRLTTTTSRGGSTEQHLHYLHRDHLGSIEKITDKTGYVLTGSQQAFDPFGERKNTSWTGGLTTGQEEALLNKQGLTSARGFTDHEHLDRLGLIHMNGRIYDPELGRFLSPDPFVQGATSQFWNRYSYAFNNPMRFTDPSGYTNISFDCKHDGCKPPGTEGLEEGYMQAQAAYDEEQIIRGEKSNQESEFQVWMKLWSFGYFNNFNVSAQQYWDIGTQIEYNLAVSAAEIAQSIDKSTTDSVNDQTNNKLGGPFSLQDAVSASILASDGTVNALACAAGACNWTPSSQMNTTVFKQAGRVLFVGAAGLEVSDMFDAVTQRDGVAAADSGVDGLMLGMGLLGPVGFGLSFTYSALDALKIFESAGSKVADISCGITGEC